MSPVLPVILILKKKNTKKTNFKNLNKGIISMNTSELIKENLKWVYFNYINTAGAILWRGWESKELPY